MTLKENHLYSSDMYKFKNIIHIRKISSGGLFGTTYDLTNNTSWMWGSETNIGFYKRLGLANHLGAYEDFPELFL